MSYKDDLTLFYELYKNSVEVAELESTFPDSFYESFYSGDTTVLQKNLFESKTFDEEWIDEFEKFIPSLNAIVSNPRTFLKYEEEIVNIERAKRINSQSVRHLASNTQNIHNVVDGRVQPKRILTAESEDDDGLYENRFVMTLIDRLYIFIHDRYKLIKDNIDSFSIREFKVESKFPISDATLDMNVSFNLRDNKTTEKINTYNNKLFERIDYIYRVVNSLKHSKFMQILAKFQPVKPPIVKTQILLKQPDYHNAYNLWLFLDRYDAKPFEVNNKSKDLPLDKEYKDDIGKMALVLFSTVISHQEDNKELYEKLKFKKIGRKRQIRKDDRRTDTGGDGPGEGYESNVLNEFFLEQNKKIFHLKLKEHQENVKLFETAMKRTLRDMIAITNSLYNSLFALDGDMAVKEMLALEGKDTDLVYDHFKEKLDILQMIRETKNVDFNNTVRLEKQWIKRLEALGKRYKLNIEEQIEDEKIRVKELEKLELDALKLKEDEKLADLKYDLAKKEAETLIEMKRETDEELKELIKELKEKHKEEIAKINKNSRDRIREANLEYREHIKTARRESRTRLRSKTNEEALRRAEEKRVARLKASEALRAEFLEIEERTLAEIEKYTIK